MANPRRAASSFLAAAAYDAHTESSQRRDRSQAARQSWRSGDKSAHREPQRGRSRSAASASSRLTHEPVSDAVDLEVSFRCVELGQRCGHEHALCEIERQVAVQRPSSIRTHSADRVFSPSASESDVCDALVPNLVASAMAGTLGAAIVAGPPRSGKSNTLLGREGLVASYCHQLVYELAEQGLDEHFTLRVEMRELLGDQCVEFEPPSEPDAVPPLTRISRALTHFARRLELHPVPCHLLIAVHVETKRCGNHCQDLLRTVAPCAFVELNNALTCSDTLGTVSRAAAKRSKLSAQEYFTSLHRSASASPRARGTLEGVIARTVAQVMGGSPPTRVVCLFHFDLSAIGRAAESYFEVSDWLMAVKHPKGAPTVDYKKVAHELHRRLAAFDPGRTTRPSVRLEHLVKQLRDENVVLTEALGKRHQVADRPRGGRDIGGDTVGESSLRAEVDRLQAALAAAEDELAVIRVQLHAATTRALSPPRSGRSVAPPQSPAERGSQDSTVWAEAQRLGLVDVGDGTPANPEEAFIAMAQACCMAEALKIRNGGRTGQTDIRLRQWCAFFRFAAERSDTSSSLDSSLVEAARNSPDAFVVTCLRLADGHGPEKSTLESLLHKFP